MRADTAATIEAIRKSLRLLAQHCEPLFFQRLRVEQQIGYVVSCRYQRVADRDGLLMALQSPDRRAGELLRCGKDFLRQLAPMDEATFRLLQQRLAAQALAGHGHLEPLVHDPLVGRVHVHQHQAVGVFREDVDALELCQLATFFGDPTLIPHPDHA